MMSFVSRCAAACAVAGAVMAVGAHGVAADVIGNPNDPVVIATGGDCATSYSGVAVSTTGCAFGTVAVSGTGRAFGGIAVSGTGEAVSGTGGASGCGDLGAVAVSGTGQTYACHGVNVSGGNAGWNPYDPSRPCDTYGTVNVSLLGQACPGTVSVSCGRLVLRSF